MLRRNRMEREMDEEMRFHSKPTQRDLMREVVAEHEALRQARLEFGGMETTKDECRDAVGVTFLETLAAGCAARRPHHDAMLRVSRLSPLPFLLSELARTPPSSASSMPCCFGRSLIATPDQLVTILMNGDNPVAVANYIDWRDQSRSFSAMGAADYWSPNLTGIDSPEHIYGLKVTQNLFPMLGVNPMLGRLFVEGRRQRRSGPRGHPQLWIVAAEVFWRSQRAREANPSRW